MRDGWTRTTLGEIAEVVMGQSPRGRSYNSSGDGLPFLQGAAEFGRDHPTPTKWCTEPKKLAQPDDLLMSVRAPVGLLNTADQIYATGRGLAVIRGGSQALTRFLALVLETGASELLARSSGGMFTSITGATLRTVPVNLPPFAEQRRIVDLTNSVDETASACGRALEALQRLRSALLADLASGDHALGSAEPEAGVRAGVTHTTLGAIAAWYSGGTPKVGTTRFYGGSIPWAVISDLDDGPVASTATQITEDGLAAIGGRVAPPGAVLVSMYGTIGRLGLAVTPLATNQAIAWGDPNRELVDPLYLFYALMADRRALDQHGRGATQRNINRQIIKSWPIVLPPLAGQRQIVKQLSAVDEALRGSQRTLAGLKNLRSALLSDLLSGEHEIAASYDWLLGSV